MSDESPHTQFFDGKDLPPLFDSEELLNESPNWSLRFRQLSADKGTWGVTLLVILYVGWFIHLSLKQYYIYGDPPFDLAIFDQGMWLLAHFHIPFVTVIGRNLFGDHTSFVLLFFAPFYRLFPEPQGILVLQTLLLAAPAVPLFVLARKFIKNTWVATMLVAMYLLNPLIQQGAISINSIPKRFKCCSSRWPCTPPSSESRSCSWSWSCSR